MVIVMGKPTGFLEYNRKDDRAAEPLERIKNFNEFHTPMSDKERKEQAVWHGVKWHGIRLSFKQPCARME